MFQLAAMLGPAALATKEFKVYPEGRQGLYVRIVGRKAGFFAWFLNLIGVDATTVFEVFENRIVFRNSNLSGSLTTTLPLASICETSSGYFKPVLYLVLGVLTLPMILTIIGAIVPILFFIFFFLHKALLISVQSNSGGTVAIAFKRSVIEGVKVEEADASKVVDIINHLLLIQQGRPAKTPSANPAAALSPRPTACPKCAAKVEPESIFCDACGHRLN